MSEILLINEYAASYAQIQKIVNFLNNDGIIACPSATGYNLIVAGSNRLAVKRLQKSFAKDKKEPVVLLSSINDIGSDIALHQTVFKCLKKNTPSSCTFIISTPPAIAAQLVYERKSEVALRVPDESLLQTLLADYRHLVAFGAFESDAHEFSVTATELLESFPELELLIIDYDQPVLIKPSTIVNCLKLPITVQRQGDYCLL